MLAQQVLAHYRCPQEVLSSENRSEISSSRLMEDLAIGNGLVPSSLVGDQLIDYLRLEQYSRNHLTGLGRVLKSVYYKLRPFTTRSLRTQIKKIRAHGWRKIAFPRWPVDTTVEQLCEMYLLQFMRAKGVGRVPFVWFWPLGAQGCVLMTHDVEERSGLDFCRELMHIDDSYGVKGSFQIVPEDRYPVPMALVREMQGRGFEVAVQDLNHDGRLFDNRKEFLRRMESVRRYAEEYGARGFRAAVLYRNTDWYDALPFSFDMSIPNVAHLDPQRGGCCTVFPYFIGNVLEIPVTTTQDCVLFDILNERSIDLWKKQVQLILEKNGLMSFIVHPDYIIEPDKRSIYEDLLRYLRDLGHNTNLWFALPSEIDSWWRQRSLLRIVKDGNSWKIENDKSGRAVLAFAKNVEGKLVYELACANATSGL